MKAFFAVFVALLPVSAVAADQVVRGAPEGTAISAPHFDWDGLYFGVTGGFGWGDLDWTYTDPPPITIAPQSTEGPLVGATLGYNLAVGRVLFGVEGDFGWADIRGSTDCPNTAYRCRSDLETFGTARARVGFIANRLLLFGTAGAAFGAQQIDTRIFIGGKPRTAGTTRTAVGWAAGLGAEYAFAARWTGKAEWLHYDLGSDEYRVDSGFNVKAGQAGDIVRIGLNYRFN